MDIHSAINYGLMVREAERIGDDGDTTAYHPPAGYTFVQAIFANDLKTDISPDGRDYVPFGYVARSAAPANEFVVAIRGTDNIWEWIQDASFGKITCPFLQGSGDSEDGFTNLYSTLRIGLTDGCPRLVDHLRELVTRTPGATITVCGHSLGSAIATLLALDLAGNVGLHPTVYTFASPNVGDSQFAATYNRLVPNTWRLVVGPDIIPQLPPGFLFGYEPAGATFGLTPGRAVKVNLLCYHDLATYLHLLALMGGRTPIPLDPKCQP